MSHSHHTHTHALVVLCDIDQKKNTCENKSALNEVMTGSNNIVPFMHSQRVLERARKRATRTHKHIPLTETFFRKISHECTKWMEFFPTRAHARKSKQNKILFGICGRHGNDSEWTFSVRPLTVAMDASARSLSIKFLMSILRNNVAHNLRFLRLDDNTRVPSSLPCCAQKHWSHS